MEDISKDLLKLKGSIDSAKAEQQKLSGQIEEKYKQLETQFGVTNLKDGQALLEKKQKELDALEADIQEGYKKLKGDFTW